MAQTGGHPFTAHLVAVLSIYELGPGRPVRALPTRSHSSRSGSRHARALSVPPPFPMSPPHPPVEYVGAAPLPRYDGPRDWQTDAVERALGRVAARMYAAEAQLQEYISRESHASTPDPTLSPRSNGLKKRRENPVDGDAWQTVRFQDVADQELDEPDTPIARPKDKLKPGTIALPQANNLTKTQTDPPVQPRPGPRSAPSSSIASSMPVFACHSCGRPMQNPTVPDVIHAPGPLDVVTPAAGMGLGLSDNGAELRQKLGFGEHEGDTGSPLVLPPGPLSAAAFESGMSAVEELKLLKAQVQDVARVCKAVAEGDLSQKITVPVQGPVMVQLKDVINTMVDKLG
ncbi:hypothetical protein FRC11_014361, partial [Ceratobasidium sp. 423]